MNAATQNIELLGTFKDLVFDLSFLAEGENGVIYNVLIDLGEIAEFLSVRDKQINLIDGSDDVMEAGREMFERWKTGTTSYSVEVKKNK